jgi:hypothetical protein
MSMPNDAQRGAVLKVRHCSTICRPRSAETLRIPAGSSAAPRPYRAVATAAA